MHFSLQRRAASVGIKPANREAARLGLSGSSLCLKSAATATAQSSCINTLSRAAGKACDTVRELTDQPHEQRQSKGRRQARESCLARSSRQPSALTAICNSTPAAEPLSLPAFTIRSAEKVDWWTVSELHCRAFYPNASCLPATLLRFDRVETIWNGTVAGEKASIGGFSCAVACMDDVEAASVDRPKGPRLPGMLQAFVRPDFREGYGTTPEDVGMLGTVIVESTGQHIPPRRRNGFAQVRTGIAYVCNLAVDEAFRRRGIGRKLLDHATEIARGWGCHAIALHCDPRNDSAAQLYVQEGYRTAALEPFLLQFWEGRPGTRLQLMIKTLQKRP